MKLDIFFVLDLLSGASFALGLIQIYLNNLLLGGSFLIIGSILIFLTKRR